MSWSVPIETQYRVHRIDSQDADSQDAAGPGLNKSAGVVKCSLKARVADLPFSPPIVLHAQLRMSKE
jgi:hypothetical protein